MREMLLLFSHTLNKAQELDAKESYGVESFVILPDELQELWSSIPADMRDISNYLQPIRDFVLQYAHSGNIALVQGDFGATYEMVNFCKSLDILPLYATTKRNVVEQTRDGKVVKTSVFEHVLFREY
ncbi:Uncharacterized protein MJ1673 [hydrothermal vent metagenome]|uniref:Uncharacterized protein MJ1673 n=1 Tax=hydrothermal vent metagenome TaxID=652676 RepID=A0A1W1B9I8_9ZZZZ